MRFHISKLAFDHQNQALDLACFERCKLDLAVGQFKMLYPFSME